LDGACSRLGRNDKCLVAVKPEGKGPLERPRRKWENNIKIYLKETGWGCVAWINVAQDRDRSSAHVNMAMNILLLSMKAV
jgi:hypothetical protein